MIPSRDARLARHIEHDARSLAYNVVDGLRARVKAWTLARSQRAVGAVLWTRHSPILDQGNLGSCTGNAMAGLLGTEPFASAGAAADDEGLAVQLYSMATQLDAIRGQYPPTDTGSSGLAVAKAAQHMGLITGYKHAFSTAGLILALQSGPVIVGVPWYDGFFHPDPSGKITISGAVAGGHEFLVRGYDPSTGLFTADNSWGTGWGKQGSFYFHRSVWDQLVPQRADVTAPFRSSR